MKKINYLNVGCGNKYHKDWINIDMVSDSPDVKATNLIKGIPYPDNTFDVVYHSQVLEHIPKEKALDFIKECYRVLKPGGIIRVVVPDLENIVDEYRKFLNENIDNHNDISEANYDWILLEMYDQTVRNYSGGQMAEFLKQPQLNNEKYVIDRIGYVGKNTRNRYLNGSNLSNNLKMAFSSWLQFNKALRFGFRKIKHLISSNSMNIGSFRLGGEIHMWMYDRYSLNRLLKNAGFDNISRKDPIMSEIPDWNLYELDVKENIVYDPTSLFMEARK